MVNITAATAKIAGFQHTLGGDIGILKKLDAENDL
jgi:hypothetical protein